jgi:hypothetical protein
MTKEELIRMAREAGLSVWDNERASMEGDGDALERFAALVAAAEREACAKVCEEEIKRVKPIYSVTAENCVKAIRARGQE